MSKPTIEVNHFINGQYVPSKSGKTFTIFNPATEEKLADVQEAQLEDVNAAVDAAEAAFPSWSKTPPMERARCLRQLAELMKRDTDKLGELESKSMGVPISYFRLQMTRVYACLQHFAALTMVHLGQSSHEGMEGFVELTIRQPFGVTAAIIPWNVSLLLAVWKLGPALGAGNTIVIKSSEKSPLACLELGRLCNEAGIPKGVVNIISGFGPVAGKAIAEHMKIRKISFTGSARTGRLIQEMSARSNMKRVTLELGGKGPSIVFKDADLTLAAKACAGSMARNSGQICSANTRVYVHESVSQEFTKLYVDHYKSLVKHGDPLDSNTTQGPLVDKLQFDRVMKYIEVGRGEGKLACGGNRKEGKGYFIEPTVFLGVSDSATINSEEIFGPVSIIHTFKTEAEVLKRANDTEYGLSSSVYTRDISRALRVAQALETGQVGVNVANIVGVDVPFGGVKQSGIGRENGTMALDHYTEIKTIYLPCSPTPDPEE
ncbi:aldehyde dehydrogenase [Atractiella rhizophila]|nr:aldehyde dehydrogenase [Atractiella rhizophila]